jgi:rare lipoprotein A
MTSLFPKLHRLTASVLFVLLVSGCSSSRYSQYHDSAPTGDIDLRRIDNVVPRAEPRSKYGNSPSYVVRGKRYYVMQDSRNFVERGVASWYGKKFHGHRTSSGETYDMYKMSAAHKNLPLPTYVEVRHLHNGKSIIVRVNDRGPFHDNRIIDLSYAAAKKLGITAQGTGVVEIRAIDPYQYHRDKHMAQKSAAQPVRTTTATSTDYRLFLQVGAFVSRTNAEQLRSRLLAELGSHSINTGYSEEKNVYRVRIGPLTNVEQADQLAMRIAQLGFAEPHIVID